MSARVRNLKRGGKYASGGKISGVQVPGASIIKDAESDSDGFKKGGKIALATGGKARMNLGKVPRKSAGGPVRLAIGGPPGMMPAQAMGAGRPGGMPAQAFGGARPSMPVTPAGGMPSALPAQANPAAVANFPGGAVPPQGMPTPPIPAVAPAIPPQAAGILGGAPNAGIGRPFKKGGKVTRLASGGSPFSSAGKGGQDAPDKGGECS